MKIENVRTPLRSAATRRAHIARLRDILPPYFAGSKESPSEVPHISLSFTHFLDAEGLLPLLAPRLLATPASEPEIETRVRERYAESSARHFLQQYAAKRLFQGLPDATPYLVLKGPTLFPYYPREGLRTMGDIDILVGKAHLTAIEKSFADLGFVAYSPSTHAPRFLKSREFVAKDGFPLIVHLHTHIVNSSVPGFYQCNRMTDLLLERRRLIKIDGIDIPTLSGEDFLIYLCLHAVKHSVDRLLLLVDIFLVARAELTATNISVYLDRAKAWDCEHWFCLGLQLAQDLFPMEKLPLENLPALPLLCMVFRKSIAAGFRSDHMDLPLRFGLEPSIIGKLTLMRDLFTYLREHTHAR